MSEPFDLGTVKATLSKVRENVNRRYLNQRWNWEEVNAILQDFDRMTTDLAATIMELEKEREAHRDTAWELYKAIDPEISTFDEWLAARRSE